MAQNGVGEALVLGATGGAGGEIARALLRRGWAIRTLARDPDKVKTALGPDIVALHGDAMIREEVVAAAAGVDVIIHAVNPPGYHDWAGLVLPMIDNSIAAAEVASARIALMGTVYNYGPDAGSVLSETSPQNPTTRKGAIRVTLEKRLQEAAERGMARVLIVRAGDYFGPRPGNSWFSQGLVMPGKPVTAVSYPGSLQIGHAWAYLPDVGEIFARLLARENELAAFERFHMQGHWCEPGVAMAYAIRRAVGRDVPIRKTPWSVMRLIAPFNETVRELMEMRYLWQTPLRLDNAKLKAFLGEEPQIPLDEAVRATLKGLGCL